MSFQERRPEARDEGISDIAERLRIRAHRAARAHQLAGRQAHQAHLALGIPAVALATVAGTSIFASLNSSQDSWVIAIVGSISILSAILASFQTFFNFAQAAESHEASGRRFAQLKRQLDLFLITAQRTNRIDQLPEDQINQLSEELARFVNTFGDIESAALRVPDKFYDRARQEQTSDDEGV